MKVWNNTWYPQDFLPQVSPSAPFFVHEITRHFENLFYGEGVKEIFYIEVCVKPIYDSYKYGEVLFYNETKKIVEAGIRLDFNLVEEMDNPAFARYLANKYMERSTDIKELNIPNFDLEKYLTEIESLFRSYSYL